jgi:hypothetical protein
MLACCVHLSWRISCDSTISQLLGVLLLESQQDLKLARCFDFFVSGSLCHWIFDSLAFGITGLAIIVARRRVTLTHSEAIVCVSAWVAISKQREASLGIFGVELN